MVNQYMLFLGQFLKDPRTLGAIAPSSRALARAMVAGIDLEAADRVVEFGPGLGAFTREILARKGPGTAYAAVECNPTFARRLAAMFPEARILVGDAAEAERLLGPQAVGTVDAVISGLPFANFDGPTQERILEATVRLLKPGGVFATFSYIHTWPFPRPRAFRALLARLFGAVSRRPVLPNLPPAFVLQGRTRT